MDVGEGLPETNNNRVDVGKAKFKRMGSDKDAI
jgi:hypothetical protein